MRQVLHNVLWEKLYENGATFVVLKVNPQLEESGGSVCPGS